MFKVFLASFFIPLWLLLTQTINAATIPTSAFFERGIVDQMKISPDGEHVALSIPNEDNALLVIINLQTNDAVAQFRTPKRQRLRNIIWANDERIVFDTLIFRGGLDAPLRTGALYALNIDNTQKFQLAGYSVRDRKAFHIIHTLPNDPRHMRIVGASVKRRSIARSRPTSYLLDIYRSARSITTRTQANRRSKVGSPLPWGNLHSDNEGEVRVATATSEEGNTQIMYRSGTSGKWRDLASHFSLQGGAEKLELDFIGFSHDNATFYLLKTGEYGTTALIEYLPDSNTTRLVYQNSDFDLNPGSIVYSNEHDEVIGVKILGDYLQSHYFGSHPDIKLHQSLDAAFLGELVRITSVTRDGDKAIVGVFGPQRLAEFYLLNTRDFKLTTMDVGSKELLTEKMATVDAFAIRTLDGITLHGYITMPQETNEALPMIVIPHGGPIGVRDNFLFDREAQFFAHHGYAVLQVNFRGSGGFGLAHRLAGYGQWGTGMIDDITLATRWAVQKGIADEDKICIYGASYGAFAALASITRDPDRYRCAVGYAGVYDLTKLGKSDIPFNPGGKNYLSNAVGDDEAELTKQSPVYHTDKIKVPVFIAHGGMDRRAPVFQAEELRAALKKSNVPYEWFIKPNETHGFYSTQHQEELYDKMLDFFGQHLQ